MIKFELERQAVQTTCAKQSPHFKIHCSHLGFENLDVMKNASERISDVTGMQISGCDFVQHRREQNKVLAADQRYFNIRPASQVFIEILCRVQSCEAAAGNDYFGLLHFSGGPEWKVLATRLWPVHMTSE